MWEIDQNKQTNKQTPFKNILVTLKHFIITEKMVQFVLELLSPVKNL